MDIFVCDDDRDFLTTIELMLMESGKAEVIRSFQQPEELLKTLRDESFPEVILMDIDYAGEAVGISCAEKIRELAPDAQVIYVTGYVDRFVQDVFLNEVNLCGFLKKPVEKEKLLAFLQKAEERIRKREKEMLILKIKGKMESVKISELLYLESEGHKVYLHMIDKEYVLYEKLDVIKKQLPEKLFLHCHKSYLINMEYIVRIEPQKVLLKNQQEIRISRGRYQDSKEKYFEYLRGEL